MAIIVLLTAFFTTFFSLGILQKSRTDYKELLLHTVLIFCGLVVFSTELLSAFYSLNFGSVLIFWLIITIVTLLFCYVQKEKSKAFFQLLKIEFKDVRHKISSAKSLDKWLLLAALLILILVFVQGIVYPPNNWDSMNYHMGRIPSWISHQSVAHYPTGAIRQIYQPPFAEFVIMHFSILNRADYFASSVQYIFLIFAIVALLAIADEFALSFPYKVLMVFLTLTIPEIILQATSTQNDLVVAFFVVAAFYLVLKFIRESSAKNAFYFGLAVGCGILTKGTAYVYMPAMLLIFGVTILIKLYSTRNYKLLLFSLLAATMFLAVNYRFYARNYQLTNNLLGVDEKEYGTYSNEKMSAKLLFSSIIKNAGNHVGLFHFKPLSVITAHGIIKLHHWMGVDIDDPANNYYKDKYDVLYNPAHEDAAPNFIELILVTAALILIIVQTFKSNVPLPVKLLVFAVLFQGIFFSLYLKFQPFHTRLQTSLFLVSVPLVCYAVSLLKNNTRKVFFYITPFLFAYALMIVLANLNHPYNKTITKSRYEKYFIAKPWIYDEYNGITQKIQAENYKNIGLTLGDGDNDFEYTLFTNCYHSPINPIYINVTNFTRQAKAFGNAVDCIVTTTSHAPYLDFKGKRFYNQTPGNKFIYLYK